MPLPPNDILSTLSCESQFYFVSPNSLLSSLHQKLCRPLPHFIYPWYLFRRSKWGYATCPSHDVTWPSSKAQVPSLMHPVNLGVEMIVTNCDVSESQPCNAATGSGTCTFRFDMKCSSLIIIIMYQLHVCYTVCFIVNNHTLNVLFTFHSRDPFLPTTTCASFLNSLKIKGKAGNVFWFSNFDIAHCRSSKIPLVSHFIDSFVKYTWAFWQLVKTKCESGPQQSNRAEGHTLQIVITVKEK